MSGRRRRDESTWVPVGPGRDGAPAAEPAGARASIETVASTATPAATAGPFAPAPFPLLGPGGAKVPHVERIAVLRGGGLGDLIFALPALDALRAAYADAEIVLLGQAWAAAFLATRPSPVDRVAPLPVVPGVHEPAGRPEDPEDTAAFFAAMEAERFDLAIQIHGGGSNSNPFVRRLRARVTAGLQAPDAPALDRTTPYVYYQSEVLRDLEVVSLVGAQPVGLEPRLAVTDDDRAQAAGALPPGAGPLAVLHPGAGDARRRWPAESFAAVGDALAAAGATVLVTGAAEESGLTRAVADAMTAPALDLGGSLSLAGLAGLLSRAAVVVANDTGPLHLARAVGAATVGIYWCGNVINAGPLSVGRHRFALSWRLECSECGADCTVERCEHAVSFVADVPVDAVRAPALELLGASTVRSVLPRRRRPAGRPAPLRASA